MSLAPEELAGIFAALEPDKQIKALAAAGISLGGLGNPFAGAGEVDVPDELAPWNRTEVKVPFTQRRPIVDKARTVEAPPPPPMPAQYAGDPGLDSIAPFAATAGQ
jgi:hypothetical protein